MVMDCWDVDTGISVNVRSDFQSLFFFAIDLLSRWGGFLKHRTFGKCKENRTRIVDLFLQGGISTMSLTNKFDDTIPPNTNSFGSRPLPTPSTSSMNGRPPPTSILSSATSSTPGNTSPLAMSPPSQMPVAGQGPSTPSRPMSMAAGSPSQSSPPPLTFAQKLYASSNSKVTTPLTTVKDIATLSTAPAADTISQTRSSRASMISQGPPEVPPPMSYASRYNPHVPHRAQSMQGPLQLHFPAAHQVHGPGRTQTMGNGLGMTGAQSLFASSSSSLVSSNGPPAIPNLMTVTRPGQQFQNGTTVGSQTNTYAPSMVTSQSAPGYGTAMPLQPNRQRPPSMSVSQPPLSPISLTGSSSGSFSPPSSSLLLSSAQNAVSPATTMSSMSSPQQSDSPPISPQPQSQYFNPRPQQTTPTFSTMYQQPQAVQPAPAARGPSGQNNGRLAAQIIAKAAGSVVSGVVSATTGVQVGRLVNVITSPTVVNKLWNSFHKSNTGIPQAQIQAVMLGKPGADYEGVIAALLKQQQIQQQQQQPQQQMQAAMAGRPPTAPIDYQALIAEVRRLQMVALQQQQQQLSQQLAQLGQASAVSVQPQGLGQQQRPPQAHHQQSLHQQHPQQQHQQQHTSTQQHHTQQAHQNQSQYHQQAHGQQQHPQSAQAQAHQNQQYPQPFHQGTTSPPSSPPYNHVPQHYQQSSPQGPSGAPQQHQQAAQQSQPHQQQQPQQQSHQQSQQSPLDAVNNYLQSLNQPQNNSGPSWGSGSNDPTANSNWFDTQPQQTPASAPSYTDNSNSYSDAATNFYNSITQSSQPQQAPSFTADSTFDPMNLYNNAYAEATNNLNNILTQSAAASSGVTANFYNTLAQTLQPQSSDTTTNLLNSFAQNLQAQDPVPSYTDPSSGFTGSTNLLNALNLGGGGDSSSGGAFDMSGLGQALSGADPNSFNVDLNVDVIFGNN
ncbi:hypothetical protein BDN70DRAFT_586209 [Pholiota conissans]|uniref:Uncharacterized protein n=1 Tax=Pholiota conissans TaxID=109636 RepID=A0A9P5Z3J9_9AGAR|nr:hypothetical protein BDN70DRAFT_586209 [Pholiota conissans]